jgi:ribosomal protein S18 acetylase RimI-like enzyme
MQTSLAKRAARDSYSRAMQPALAHRPAADVRIRAAAPADIDDLVALEQRVFSTDRISRRGFRRFLRSRSAALLVAVHGETLAGYALVLVRAGSDIARLYSIAVAPEAGRRGVGVRLLAAAEETALARDRVALRLEVHENNAAAIARYQKSGYTMFGRHFEYYGDRGHALRFEKRLMPQLRGLETAPPYFHQTTDFTCGPACVMMALGWADRSLRPNPILELKLWREATTICMTSGPGGCEPYGLAVTLRRHGLYPEIHVSRAGPYFIDTVAAADKKRVMRLAQQEFQREARELGIHTHITPLAESALLTAFDQGAVAIVLAAGYHMVRRTVPHWVFAFGHEGRYVLVHDPAAFRDEHGHATSAETYAVPSGKFARMTRFGRDGLRAAILIRKEPIR